MPDTLPRIYIEHVNLSVQDAEASAQWIARLFDWHMRWAGPTESGGRSVHVGDKNFYLALHTPQGALADALPTRHEKGLPLNHVGILVDDLDAMAEEVDKLGFERTDISVYDPGRRFYFFDDNGIEFELIQYS